jgi:hypothetical protein
VKGEVPKIDKFLRRAVSFVMCFLQKAERRERERERGTSIILTGRSICTLTFDVADRKRCTGHKVCSRLVFIHSNSCK